MFDVGQPLIDEKAIEKDITKEKLFKSDKSDKSDKEDNSELKGLEEKKGIDLVTVFSVIILVLFIGASVALFLLKLSKNSTLKNKQEAFDRLQQQLSSKQMKETEEQYRTISKGLTEVASQLNKRILFKFLFESIDSKIPQGVMLSDLSIDEKLNIKLSGTADTDMTVAVFLAALDQSDEFSKVNLDNFAYETTESSQSETSGEISHSDVESVSPSTSQGGSVSFSMSAVINNEKKEEENKTESEFMGS